MRWHQILSFQVSSFTTFWCPVDWCFWNINATSSFWFGEKNITLDKNLIKRLWGIVVYNVVLKSKVEIVLAFFLYSWEWIFHNPKRFKVCVKRIFSMKTFKMIKNHCEKFGNLIKPRRSTADFGTHYESCTNWLVSYAFLVNSTLSVSSIWCMWLNAHTIAHASLYWCM